MRVSAEFCFARKSAVLQHKNSGGAQRKTTVLEEQELRS
jgi:hypothetical protein